MPGIPQQPEPANPDDAAGAAPVESPKPSILPGRPKAGEITLVRGLTADTSFEKWVKSSQFGQMGNARKGGAIIVFDFEGNAIKRYKLMNAWPKTLEIGSLKAGDTSVLTEKLVITYETMEVE